MIEAIKKLEKDLDVISIVGYPVYALEQRRIMDILKLRGEQKGIARQQYIAHKMTSRIPMEEYVRKAVDSPEGDELRKKLGISKEEHEALERKELSDLYEYNEAYRQCLKKLSEPKKDELITFFQPRTKLDPILEELRSAKTSFDFVRIIMRLKNEGAFKKGIKGSELQRALKEVLSNTPITQTINKALSGNIPISSQRGRRKRSE